MNDQICIWWIDENPNCIVCSPRNFVKFGGELFGLPLDPDYNCCDYWFYGVNDYKLVRNLLAMAPF